MANITNKSDEEIIEIVRSQNKEAYAEIVKRYQAKLMRYATNMSNDLHAASDIVQESFIKAYINLNGFNTKKKFSSWIYRIVHNEAINMIRKQKHTQWSDKALDKDSGVDLEDEFIKNELKQHTHKCLNMMPVIYREPLSLYFLEEKSYEEICDILRLPLNTVGSRINRAKKIMKKICQKYKK